MELKRISITNYRGIESKEFNFSSQFNVLIGENAVGKTSLMEAIAVGFGGFVKGLNYKNGRSITKEDIRITNYSNKITRAPYAEINLFGDILGEKFNWIRRRENRKELADLDFYREVYEYGKHLAKESLSGRFITLPLISYYGTGRLMKENDSEFNPERTEKRVDGYNKALNPNSNYKTLLAWFKAKEISVYKSGKGIEALQCVKRAVKNSFDEIETIYFDENNQLLSILLKGLSKSESLPVSTLSDGQKNLIGLIGDIALRCVLLNPHFGESAHEKTPGIILIDELDLHLHPNWQRKIVDILRTTFPKIQFIVTTHSPFIIQSLKNNELIPLDKNIFVSSDPFRKSIEEIAEVEMNVSDVLRSRLFIEMENTASEYFKLIKQKGDKKRFQEIESKLSELEMRYSEDPAYVALLKAERSSKN